VEERIKKKRMKKKEKVKKKRKKHFNDKQPVPRLIL